MARIRSIKPEFWQDELVGSWPRETRLVYIALWSEADDEGRLRANPARLRAALFPYDDDLDAKAFASLLAPIVESGRLRLYRSENQTYGWLPNFNAHQRIEKASRSRLPPFTEASEVFLDDSGNIPGILPEASRKESRNHAKSGFPESSRNPPGMLPEASRWEGKGSGKGSGRGEEDAREDDAPPPADAGPLSLAPLEPEQSAFGPTALLDLWNKAAPIECPRARELSPGRRKRAAARIREHPDPDYWRAVISRLAESGFARGHNDRGWCADFDWLMRPDSTAKTLEGKYDDKHKQADFVAPSYHTTRL